MDAPAPGRGDDTADPPQPPATSQLLPVVGAGPGIALGPDHPSIDGAMSLRVTVGPGPAGAAVVRSAEAEIGMVHRGVEKLFESRDYRQVIALADRHDWLGAFCSEIGVAVALERMLGIRVPPRAGIIRVLLCELTRISHHLAFLTALPGSLPRQWRATAAQLRSCVLAALEHATGQRIHPMFTVIGGVREDLGHEVRQHLVEQLPEWRPQVAELTGATLSEALGSLTGVAVLSRAQAAEFGASGPVARASGLDLDLRRDAPYLPYPAEWLRVPVRSAGDAAARVACLADELHVSLELVDWGVRALQDCPGQPVNVRLPKVVRAPEGAAYVMTENPSGINGYYLVSRNERTPWRLKLRSAGFGNAAAMVAALPGTTVADLPHAVASFFLVPGDVDR